MLQFKYIVEGRCDVDHLVRNSQYCSFTWFWASTQIVEKSIQTYPHKMVSFRCFHKCHGWSLLGYFSCVYHVSWHDVDVKRIRRVGIGHVPWQLFVKISRIGPSKGRHSALTKLAFTALCNFKSNDNAIPNWKLKQKIRFTPRMADYWH